MILYFWQVAVHATVMGVIFYAWAQHVRLPSGRTKRTLLALLLVLPLITAAVPGRGSLEFAERTAWLNSARVLAVPLPMLDGWRVAHLVLALAIGMVLVTIWQDVLLSAVRRPPVSDAEPPPWLVTLARAQPAWTHCEVAVSPLPSTLVATSGWPSRPRLIVSRGALESLSETDLASVIAHEHAHWTDGRWWRLHGLFVVRLLQSYHPVALWVFREYCLEVEVECDAAAGGKPLTRILYGIYQTTDRRDTAARAILRKRIDVLMAGGPADDALPISTVAAAAALMALALPWIV